MDALLEQARERTGEDHRPAGGDAVDRLMTAGLALALAGVSVYLLARAVNQLLLAAPSSNLDPGGERNPFAWATTVATFTAGFAALVHAAASPWRRGWFVLIGGSCTLLSMSDAVELHERAGAKLFQQGLGWSDVIAGQAEVLLYAPLLALTVFAVWRLAEDADPRPGRLGQAAIVALVAAIALELVGAATRQLGDQGFVNQARMGLEDAAEIAGWTLLATFFTALLSTALIELGRRQH